MESVKDAGLKPTEIDEVILVGGQTRMPKVQEIVKSFLREGSPQGREPRRSRAIRRGDSGGVLAGEVKDVLHST